MAELTEEQKKAAEEAEKQRLAGQSKWDKFSETSPLIAMVIDLLTHGQGEALFNGEITLKEAFKEPPEKVAEKSLQGLANMGNVLELGKTAEEIANDNAIDKLQGKIDKLDAKDKLGTGQEKRLTKLKGKHGELVELRDGEGGFVEQRLERTEKSLEASLKLIAQAREEFPDNKTITDLADKAKVRIEDAQNKLFASQNKIAPVPTETPTLTSAQVQQVEQDVSKFIMPKVDLDMSIIDGLRGTKGGESKDQTEINLGTVQNGIDRSAFGHNMS